MTKLNTGNFVVLKSHAFTIKNLIKQLGNPHNVLLQSPCINKHCMVIYKLSLFTNRLRLRIENIKL